jgi:hypothetical protein
MFESAFFISLVQTGKPGTTPKISAPHPAKRKPQSLPLSVC